MSSKNELPALLVALVFTTALIGGGAWWLVRSLQVGNGLLRSNHPSGAAVNPSGARTGQNVEQYVSTGTQTFFPQTATDLKRDAIDSYNAGNYLNAAQLLERSLQENRNDPEARIFLNNARILYATVPSPGQSEPVPPQDELVIDAILVSVPIKSDPNGALEILRGVAQAQDEANASGDRALFVWIADDANDPAIAQQIATYAVEKDALRAVVGHYASDVTLAAAPTYEAGGMVVISPVSSSVKLTDFGNYVFRTVPSDFIAARALADHMLEDLQQRRAAVFYNSESGYSQSLMSEFSSALSLGGGQVVSLVDLSNGGFSAQASLTAAAQNGAETLVLLPNTGRLDEALQVVQLAQGRFTLLAGDDVYTPKTLEVGNQAAEGMIVAVPWHILAHEGSNFVNASRGMWGGDVNWRTVTAYDATRALLQAFSQVENENGISRVQFREEVQQTLRSGAFQTAGATESVQFLPSGDRNMGVQLVRVQPGNRSGLAYEFVPIARP